MREPITAPSNSTPKPEPTTPDALPGQPRKLTAPDAKFIADLTMAIRAGARVDTAALWLLGCTRTQWKKWKQRTGPVYDEMRSAIRAAQMHSEVKMQAELARRSPGAALKHLRYTRTPDDAPVEAARAYHQTRLYTLKRDLPGILDRIADPAITDLAPLEQVARDWRENVIADCGGREHLTTAKLALIQTCVGSWLCLGTIDSYVMELAGTQGLVNRRLRTVFPVVETRARLADSLARQLQALGIERKTAPQSLSEIIEQAKATHGNGHHGTPHGHGHA